MVRKVIISIFILFSINAVGYSQTTLAAGDIAIISMNCSGTDNFSFVANTAISNTTVIKFAESGWLSGGGFRGGGSSQGEICCFPFMI